MNAHVAIRVDGSERIGGGHVLRCLALAEALASAGIRVSFVSARLTAFLEARIRQGGYDLRRIDSPASAETAQWEKPLDRAGQEVDARRTADAIPSRTDWLVVDHYRLDASWEAAVGARADVVAIDDLAARPHACRILVDQTLGRKAEDYGALVPGDCRVLAGGRYAMLRAEFAAARPAALARRRRSSAIGRLLVSFGTTDGGGLTAVVLDGLLAAGLQCPIDVVLSATAASLAAATALAQSASRVRVHIDVADMAPLMAAADLALGAPGVSGWERCCLGLPTVMLQMAPNQSEAAHALAGAGAALLARDPDDLAALAARLAAAPDPLRTMSDAAARLIDGRGAQRIAAAMTALPDQASSAVIGGKKSEGETGGKA